VWVGVLFELVGGMVLCVPGNLVVLAHLPEARIGVSWLASGSRSSRSLPASTAVTVTTGFFTALHEPGGDGAAPPAGPSVAAAQHPDVYLPSQFRGRGARELSRDCAQPAAPRRLRGAGDGELPSRRATRRGRHG